MTTALMGYWTGTDGADAGAWGQNVNNLFTSYVDQNFAGITTLSLSSTNVLLTSAQARTQMLRLTGTLLASISISPDTGVLWNGIRCVENLTSGAFTITLQNSGSGSLVIPTGRRALVYIDTTNGVRAISMVGVASAELIPASYSMPFYNNTVPTGWSVASVNDYAMKIVSSGGGVTSGSVAYSTLFARTSVDGYTLQIADIPAHSHTERVGSTGAGGILAVSSTTSDTSNTSTVNTTSSVGGGGSHTHGLDLRVQTAALMLGTRSAA